MPKCFEVVVAGHSFMRRLQRYCADNQYWANLGLDADKHKVMFHGADGGGHIIAIVHQLVEYVNDILNGGRNLILVILDIGSNDLNKDSGYSQHHLVQADALLGNCVRWVVLAKMFLRKCNAARCWNAAVDQDVKLVESLCLQCTHQFNNLLKIKASAHPRMGFLHQKGLCEGWRDHLRTDGVHLMDSAMRTSFPQSMFLV